MRTLGRNIHICNTTTYLWLIAATNVKRGSKHLKIVPNMSILPKCGSVASCARYLPKLVRSSSLSKAPKNWSFSMATLMEFADGASRDIIKKLWMFIPSGAKILACRQISYENIIDNFPEYIKSELYNLPPKKFSTSLEFFLYPYFQISVWSKVWTPYLGVFFQHALSFVRHKLVISNGFVMMILCYTKIQISKWIICWTNCCLLNYNLTPSTIDANSRWLFPYLLNEMTHTHTHERTRAHV